MQPVAIPIRKGVDLAVSHQPGQGPCLVFLHGGLGNQCNWRSQFDHARRQGRQGRQVLAYDLGGHGSSSRYRRYSIGRHCRDLSRLLQHLGIDSPVLCCHSYGVPIGLEWARRNSTQALILIAGGSHALTPWWEIPMLSVMAMGGRHLFRLPLLQRWAQTLISSQRTPVMKEFFAECPIPTDAHPYRALPIFWQYELQASAHSRGGSSGHGGVSRRSE